MRINPKEISIQSQDGDSWAFEALWRGQRVGYAWCSLQNGNLIINDLKVDDAHSVPWPFMNSFLVLIGIMPRIKSFRKMGVGNQLLDRIIAEGKKSQVHSIWGSVTQDDINGVPYLLDWYKRMGFSVTAPDGNCIKTAVKKIVMKL